MVIETHPKLSANGSSNLTKPVSKTRIIIFHCINALDNCFFLESADYNIQSIKLPCSSLTREVVLLRAFEAGADAVVVLTCPEGSCRYLQGNLRAAKRVARVKKLLDEIGIDGRRLNLFHIQHGDRSAVQKIIDQTIIDVANIGPNPAG
jgi:F420-non-reducing hydrogenase iron-sulfur subunit